MKAKNTKHTILVALMISGLFLVAAAGPVLAFECYCNGQYLGEYDDIWECYNDCEAAIGLTGASTPMISFHPVSPELSGVLEVARACPAWTAAEK